MAIWEPRFPLCVCWSWLSPPYFTNPYFPPPFLCFVSITHSPRSTKPHELRTHTTHELPSQTLLHSTCDSDHLASRYGLTRHSIGYRVGSSSQRECQMTQLFRDMRTYGYGMVQSSVTFRRSYKLAFGLVAILLFSATVLGIDAYLGSIFLPNLHRKLYFYFAGDCVHELTCIPFPGDFTIFGIVVPSLTILIFIAM